jgi:3D (Asp-Asp-Asp) domain-containing protein
MGPATVTSVLLFAAAICASAADFGGVKNHRRPRAGMVMAMTATAYCQTGTTKSGERTRPGIVAADPRVLPLGSKIRIIKPERYAGVYQVMDTGSSIKGRRLDVFIPSCKDARRFGRQPVMVRLEQSALTPTVSD